MPQVVPPEDDRKIRELMTLPEELTPEEVQALLRVTPPPPTDVGAFMGQVLAADVRKELEAVLPKLPPVGVPATPDPEMEAMEEEDRRTALEEQPEMAIAAYTYGLAPELQELKSKYDDFFAKLRMWKSENLNKAKAYKDNGKRALDSWKQQAISQLKQVVKSTAPRYYQVLGEIYRVYYTEYAKLAVEYEKIRATIYQGYADTYYKARAQYYQAYNNLKAALILAGR